MANVAAGDTGGAQGPAASSGTGAHGNLHNEPHVNPRTFRHFHRVMFWNYNFDDQAVDHVFGLPRDIEYDDVNGNRIIAGRCVNRRQYTVPDNSLGFYLNGREFDQLTNHNAIRVLSAGWRVAKQKIQHYSSTNPAATVEQWFAQNPPRPNFMLMDPSRSDLWPPGMIRSWAIDRDVASDAFDNDIINQNSFKDHNFAHRDWNPVEFSKPLPAVMFACSSLYWPDRVASNLSSGEVTVNTQDYFPDFQQMEKVVPTLMGHVHKKKPFTKWRALRPDLMWPERALGDPSEIGLVQAPDASQVMIPTFANTRWAGAPIRSRNALLQRTWNSLYDCNAIWPVRAVGRMPRASAVPADWRNDSRVLPLHLIGQAIGPEYTNRYACYWKRVTEAIPNHVPTIRTNLPFVVRSDMEEGYENYHPRFRITLDIETELVLECDNYIGDPQCFSARGGDQAADLAARLFDETNLICKEDLFVDMNFHGFLSQNGDFDYGVGFNSWYNNDMSGDGNPFQSEWRFGTARNFAAQRTPKNYLLYKDASDDEKMQFERKRKVRYTNIHPCTVIKTI